jgi:hypothetical protein
LLADVVETHVIRTIARSEPMSELPFDLENPPDEPPAGVPRPMAWRLAIRLYRDHVPVAGDQAEPPACRTCGEPWPCYGRRLAERGLISAWQDLPRPTGWEGRREYGESESPDR